MTTYLFLKNGPIPASFCLFSLFSQYNFNNTYWKKHKRCAWDLNPGPQIGRRRWNHGAMVGPPQDCPESCQSFGLLLVEILSSRTLKIAQYGHTGGVTAYSVLQYRYIVRPVRQAGVWRLHRADQDARGHHRAQRWRQWGKFVPENSVTLRLVQTCVLRMRKTQ